MNQRKEGASTRRSKRKYCRSKRKKEQAQEKISASSGASAIRSKRLTIRNLFTINLALLSTNWSREIKAQFSFLLGQKIPLKLDLVLKFILLLRTCA